MDKIKRITVVETNSITFCPPDINLIENLLKNNYEVILVSNQIHLLKKEIRAHKNFKSVDLKTMYECDSKVKKIINRIKQIVKVRKIVKEVMKDSDVLWTTSEASVRDLGDIVFDYKHVFQLMELSYRGNYYGNVINFDLSEIARRAWRVVVPEINRAYIMKSWFRLNNTPYVLPNKPYSLRIGDVTNDMVPFIEKMKNEKRKIILYLGGIWGDRDLEPVAKVLNKLNDEYVLYIVGKAYGEDNVNALNNLITKYNVEYIGSFVAPKHLHFVKYAYMGLLAYRPSKSRDLGTELNAQYCAPNKIYEYSAYGIPMIGTDVMGLRYPFENYGIGAIYTNSNEDSILSAINEVDSSYKKMHENCYAFFNDCDLDGIVQRILLDD